MKKWLRGIRAAVVMGLAWALVWAPVAVPGSYSASSIVASGDLTPAAW